jgi:hypothetical protein
MHQVSRTNISGERKGQEKCVRGCANGETQDLQIIHALWMPFQNYILLGGFEEQRDIGSWPNFFGLHAWTTLLRRDCTGLVKTFDESEYNDYLRRIRVNVQKSSEME